MLLGLARYTMLLSAILSTVNLVSWVNLTEDAADMVSTSWPLFARLLNPARRCEPWCRLDNIIYKS